MYLNFVQLRMQNLAKELGVVIPVSFFEEANNAHYNSIVVIDADGTDLGLYRKSHIPDGPGLPTLIIGISYDIFSNKVYLSLIMFSSGYQEKFYFNPGDTGFKVRTSEFSEQTYALLY